MWSKKIDCFLVSKRCKINRSVWNSVYQKGQIILEPISKSWLNHVMIITITQLDYLVSKRILLALFPIFDSVVEKFSQIGTSNMPSKSIIFDITPTYIWSLVMNNFQLRGIEGTFSKF